MAVTTYSELYQRPACAGWIEESSKPNMYFWQNANDPKIKVVPNDDYYVEIIGNIGIGDGKVIYNCKPVEDIGTADYDTDCLEKSVAIETIKKLYFA